MDVHEKAQGTKQWLGDEMGTEEQPRLLIRTPLGNAVEIEALMCGDYDGTLACRGLNWSLIARFEDALKGIDV